MHEMQTIVTDVRGVCQSVCPSVSLSVCHSANSASLCGGHSVQLLSSDLGLLLIHHITVVLLFSCG